MIIKLIINTIIIIIIIFCNDLKCHSNVKPTDRFSFFFFTRPKKKISFYKIPGVLLLDKETVNEFFTGEKKLLPGIIAGQKKNFITILLLIV